MLGDIVDAFFASNGYAIKFSSGVIIQGGSVTCPEDSSQIISLLVPLTNMNFKNIQLTPMWDSNPGGTNSGPTICAYGNYYSTSNFRVWANSNFIKNGTPIGFYWQVVGLWK